MASGTEDADTRSNQQATASMAPVGLTNLDSDVSFRPFSVKKKKVTFWEGLNGCFRFREEFVKATWHLRHLYKLLLKCTRKQKLFTFLNVPAAELMIPEQPLNSRQLPHTHSNHTQLVFAYLGFDYVSISLEIQRKRIQNNVAATFWNLSNICLVPVRMIVGFILQRLWWFIQA